MRRLATIRKISKIEKIPNADSICTYVVDGWRVVDSIGKYRVGELVIMCEVDSWVPHELAPFLSKGKEPREFLGVKGERLRTVKLRGQISQGLLLQPFGLIYDLGRDVLEGEDVTEFLGILKFEKALPAHLGGLAKGNFPTFIPKTDEERVQNLKGQLGNWTDHEWEVTEKLDGSSMTVYYNNGEFGVCSRNLDLKEDENNTFWKVANSLGIREILPDLEKNIALQGELIGEGIQGNRYGIQGHEFRLFNVYYIDERRYMTREERLLFTMGLGLPQVPVVSVKFLPDIEYLLTIAEGQSKLKDTKREGIVFKSQTDTSIHFKVISNSWLLKNES